MRLVKYSVIVCLLLACAGIAWAGDYVPVGHPTSFRGLEWGTALEDVPDLLAVKGASYKDTYFRKDERMTFGDAKITSVAYYFRKGKLYRVGVAFEGRGNHFLIKERLLSMYGRGRGVGSRYGWMWPDFSVEINYNDDAKTGGLIYTYEGKLD
ncbi:hypothetical protein [Pseudodesulfovibrio sp. zrk46]|uniref:hypothetical protein n=1 Tax=Pseudodesulfovibrio sp. zrk46 TaxID=2725288 RepID=UPI001449B845|nr:hypothetical protein [Pseudodesulfovibrio sp. zrk46]QJB56215.1 hypothetical protein HFN16_07225 [Pseudodesulfovibrio sp. zrk46]